VQAANRLASTKIAPASTAESLRHGAHTAAEQKNPRTQAGTPTPGIDGYQTYLQDMAIKITSIAVKNRIGCTHTFSDRPPPLFRPGESTAIMISQKNCITVAIIAHSLGVQLGDGCTLQILAASPAKGSLANAQHDHFVPTGVPDWVQNEKPPVRGLRQLPPATDIPSRQAMRKKSPSRLSSRIMWGLEMLT